ncbi:hypothetical protein OH492_28945 [Vibrio chagasii]|nr:hypothetical protein [Vibrio chagasii]
MAANKAPGSNELRAKAARERSGNPESAASLLKQLEISSQRSDLKALPDQWKQKIMA